MPDAKIPANIYLRDGQAARVLGKPRSANPYAPESPRFILWEEGWCGAEDVGAPELAPLAPFFLRRRAAAESIIRLPGRVYLSYVGKPTDG